MNKHHQRTNRTKVFCLALACLFVTACGGGSSSGGGSGNSPLSNELHTFTFTPENTAVLFAIPNISLRVQAQRGQTQKVTLPARSNLYRGFWLAQEIPIGERAVMRVCTSANVFVDEIGPNKCREMSFTKRTTLPSAVSVSVR